MSSAQSDLARNKESILGTDLVSQREKDRLLQDYKDKHLGNGNPFLNAGVVSRLLYGWMIPLMKARQFLFFNNFKIILIFY